MLNRFLHLRDDLNLAVEGEILGRVPAHRRFVQEMLRLAGVRIVT